MLERFLGREHLERGSAAGANVELNRLSETERRIATLVAVGRTNEESAIVSS